MDTFQTAEFTPEFFDLSSRAWMANKKRKGASYSYKCALEECTNRVKKECLNCKHHEGQGIRLHGVSTRSMTLMNPQLLLVPPS
jgi:hypothetical protein